MANATWYEATNEVLSLAMLDEIETENLFNQGPLSKYQKGAKKFIRLAHKQLSVRAFRHFATRRFTILLNANDQVYTLETGLSPENIRFRTFFNVSTDLLAAQNGEIRNMPYEEFLRRHPDQSKITSGAPTHWIQMPIEEEAEDPVHRIRFYPNPDQPYIVEFQAKVHAPDLRTSTDKILFPPEYEHILWEFAWDLLERGLGEGKEGNILAIARNAAMEVRLVSGKAEDIKRAPRTMKLPTSRRNRGFIKSPRSVDENGTVID